MVNISKFCYIASSTIDKWKQRNCCVRAQPSNTAQALGSSTPLYLGSSRPFRTANQISSPPAMKLRTQAATSKPQEYAKWLLFGLPPTQKSLHWSLNALSAKTIAVIIRNIPANGDIRKQLKLSYEKHLWSINLKSINLRTIHIQIQSTRYPRNYPDNIPNTELRA